MDTFRRLHGCCSGRHKGTHGAFISSRLVWIIKKKACAEYWKVRTYVLTSTHTSHCSKSKAAGKLSFQLNCCLPSQHIGRVLLSRVWNVNRKIECHFKCSSTSSEQRTWFKPQTSSKFKSIQHWQKQERFQQRTESHRHKVAPLLSLIDVLTKVIYSIGLLK